MLEDSKQIVVVGAGIAGLTTALCLNHFGINACVYERSNEVTTAGAGIQLSPNANRVFSHIGLFDEISALSRRCKGVRVFDYKSNSQLALFDYMKFKRDAAFLFCHRSDLVSILYAACKKLKIPVHFDKKLEKILTWATTLGVAALLAHGIIIWNQYVNVPKNAIEVDVMAWQWGWQYRLPGADGKLGTTQVRNIADNNPFGINPDDPFGKDDVMIESDVINLENNRPVKILLRSVDVLHNWYVPQFRSKMDAVPGTVTFYWFEPNKVGEYEVLCAEYCGVGHYAMRGGVEVQDKADYEVWLSEQETFEQLSARYEKLNVDGNKLAKK